jgi:hypothetical protein
VKTKAKKTKRPTRKPGRAVAVRKSSAFVALAQDMRTMFNSFDSRITSMGEAIGRFDQYREQVNRRLLEIVDGKQLVLDPVLSQRLQTMANTLQAPTYVIEGKGVDGKYRTLNILSVGAFAGTVKIQVALEGALSKPHLVPPDAVYATEVAEPTPLKPGEVDPLLQR